KSPSSASLNRRRPVKNRPHGESRLDVFSFRCIVLVLRVYLSWGVKVVTKARTALKRTMRGPKARTVCRLALPVLLLHVAGCMSLPWRNANKIDPPPAPADSLVLREGGLEKDAGVDAEIQAELDAGKRL